MTRSVKPVLRSASVILLAGLVLTGCTQKNTRPSPVTQEPVIENPAPAPSAAAKPLADKGDPDQRFKDALKLLKDRQGKDAQDAFLQLAKDFPAFAGPLTDLAILQANGKQRAPAIINFQKAIKLNPQNFIAYNWLGTLQREAGDYAAAETAYRAALAVKSDYAAPHLNLGVLYDVYIKRPQDALTEYREYQRLSGGSKLVVAAWIRELEDRLQPPATAPSSTAVEHKS